MQSAARTPISLKQFLVRGMLGNLIGVSVGISNFLITAAFASLFGNNDILLTVLLGLCGIFAGAIQGQFVRPLTPPALIWLLVSGVGWSIIGLPGVREITSVIRVNVIALSLFLGLITCLPQWLLLQRSVRFAAGWLPLSAGAWVLCFLMLDWQSRHINSVVGWLFGWILS